MAKPEKPRSKTETLPGLSNLDSGSRAEQKENTISGAGMGVQTIGEAYQAGWRIHVRCAWGRREGMKSVRGCLGKAELDLHTLIWTRGGAFPLTSLEARLKCPMCGSRRVSVILDVPSEPAVMRIAGMPSR